MLVEGGELWANNTVDVAFAEEASAAFEGIEATLLAALLVEVVEHELEVLAGRAEADLVLAAVELIILHLTLPQH